MGKEFFFSLCEIFGVESFEFFFFPFLDGKKLLLLLPLPFQKPPSTEKKKIRTGLPGHGLGQQRLPRARWAVKKDPGRSGGPDRGEGRRVAQRRDGLGELALGAVRSGDIGKGDPPEL